VTIADTSVVSEFMQDAPDPVVMAWARAVAPADLTICVVTVEEIERGLGCSQRGGVGVTASPAGAPWWTPTPTPSRSMTSRQPDKPPPSW
jgi:predicted nucleic acid-binding protein